MLPVPGRGLCSWYWRACRLKPDRLTALLGRTQAKYDGFPVVAFDVRCLDHIVAGAEHLAQVRDLRIVPLHLEDMEFFAIAGMITNCLISAPELHIAALSLAVVVKNAIVTPPVAVSEWLSRLARKEKDQGVPCGRTDTATLLATVESMELAPFVEMPNVECLGQSRTSLSAGGSPVKGRLH